MKELLRKHALLRKLFIILVVIPGVPFILVSLAFAIYAFWPRDMTEVTNIDLSKSTSHFIISVHGVKDSPESWSNELLTGMSQQDDSIQQNLSLDWRPFSENPFICSIAGKRIGNKIGKNLASSTSVKSIHAIGHSCGAFVVLGLCEGIKAINSDIKVQTTYLAPVSVYAGFFWQYGVNHFGDCGDFSDAYIDREDTVPGSNQRLPNAHTFDITQLRIKHQMSESPHNWPTRYYINALKNRQVPLYIDVGDKLDTIYPKGELSKQ